MKTKNPLTLFRRLLKQFTPRRKTNLGDSLTLTTNLENQLTRSAKSFESNFLSVLLTLEELQSAGEKLSQQSATMLALNQSEDNPINSVSRKLAPNLDFVQSSAHSIRSLIKILDTNRQKINATLAFESKLDQTFSQLTYIRTLFAVEAAPLEQSAKVMFTSLVEEIHRLQKDVSEIFSSNFQALRENRVTIGKLATNLARQAEEQLTTHNSSQSEMEAAIQAQTDNLARDIQANTSLKSQSDNISQSIGSAIISLQTQDIISQKMQHIFAVSNEMRSRFNRISTLKGKRQRCIEYRFLEHAALLILNQIDSIKRELHEADRSIDSSIKNITTSIRSMEETSNDIRVSTSPQDQGPRGESLIKALGNAGEIVRSCESFLDQAFSAIKPIRNQTTNVSSTIVKLSSQLHLIGLNAEIHAARTGGSTALETLSAKTSGISVETRDLCQSISTQLDELSNALLKNVNVLESLLTEASKANRQIRDDIPIETKNLHEQSNLYTACLSETQELMDDLRRLNKSQETRLDFEATMLHELEAMQRTQSEISKAAKEAADKTKIDVNIPEIMSGLLSHYTMNSEKNIHLETLGLPQETPTQTHNFRETEPETAADPAEVDLGFDDFGFDADRQTEPEPGDGIGKNVEFF